MNTEIQKIIALLQDAYNGDPWFGRSVKSLIADVKEENVFEKPNDQHSILEMLWHMILWREFIINRFGEDKKPPEYFEENDWRNLDHTDTTLWEKGWRRLDETQTQLIETLLLQQDSILETTVPRRNYIFKKMLYGIIAHDIYHVAQITYVNKMLQNK